MGAGSRWRSGSPPPCSHALAVFGNALILAACFSGTGSRARAGGRIAVADHAAIRGSATATRGQIARAVRPCQARKLAKWTPSVLLSSYAESMIQVAPDHRARWPDARKLRKDVTHSGWFRVIMVAGRTSGWPLRDMANQQP